MYGSYLLDELETELEALLKVQGLGFDLLFRV